MKLLISLIILVLITACSSESGQLQAKELKKNGEFNLKLNNGMGFTHEAKKFKVVNATTDYFEFKSLSWHIRFSAIKLDDTTPSSSTDLVYNNTFVSFYKDIEGKRTKISCKPNQDPQGKITISSLDNNSLSGAFEFKLIKCNNFYSGDAITEFQLPIIAKGLFNNISYENHLEKLMKKN